MRKASWEIAKLNNRSQIPGDPSPQWANFHPGVEDDSSGLTDTLCTPASLSCVSISMGLEVTGYRIREDPNVICTIGSSFITIVSVRQVGASTRRPPITLLTQRGSKEKRRDLNKMMEGGEIALGMTALGRECVF